MNNLIFDPTAKFLDPERLLFGAGLTAGQTFTDLGAGSGFYSLAASKIVGEQGSVISVDVIESALDHIAAEARLKGIRNIKTIHADLDQANSCPELTAGTTDLLLLANIIHQVKNPSHLFSESYRLLKTGGKLLIIEWNDQRGPIGPESQDRITSSQATSLANKTNFKPVGTVVTDPYHYGLIFIK